MLRYIVSLLGIIVLVIFAFKIDLSELLDVIVDVKPMFLLAALGLSLLNIFLKALRWRLVTKQVALVDMSIGYAFMSVFAGVAGASLLPGRALEVTKPIMLKSSHDVPVAKTLPAVVFERLLDLATLIAVFLVSIWFVSARVQSTNTTVVTISAIGLVCLSVVMWRPQLGMLGLQKVIGRWSEHPKVTPIIESVGQFARVWDRREFKLALLSFSGAAMLAEVARAYALFMAFSIDASPSLIAFAFSGSILVGLLSLIPGGVGVTETSQFGFLTVLLPAVADGALQGAVLLDRFISYYIPVCVGALFLMFFARSGRTAEQHVGSSSEAAIP